MKNKWNKLFTLFLGLMLVWTMVLPVLAHEAVDLDRLGSITLSVKYNGKGVSGAKFTCIRIAYAAEIKGTESGFYFFRVTDDTIIDNERITGDAAALAKEMNTLYQNAQGSFAFQEQTLATNNDGQATFENLEPGLYLIRQPSAAAGYYKMSPFLVSVPYVVKTADGDWHYEYNLTVSAKSELEREPTPTQPVKDPDPTLPQTGQLWWPVPLLAVSGMAFFALGWFLFVTRRKRDAK